MVCELYVNKAVIKNTKKKKEPKVQNEPLHSCQMIFNRGAKQFNGGKNNLFNKW